MSIRIGSSYIDNPAASGAGGAGGAIARQQRRQQFEALAQALRSGDLAGARYAYTSLRADVVGAASAASALARLGKALQNGDLATARQAGAEIAQQQPRRDETRQKVASAVVAVTNGQHIDLMA